MMLVGTKGMMSIRSKSTYPLPTKATHLLTWDEIDSSTKKNKDNPRAAPRSNETDTLIEKERCQTLFIATNAASKATNINNQSTIPIRTPFSNLLQIL
jgi:hypothetical protein